MHEIETNILRGVLEDPSKLWELSSTKSISSFSFPDRLLGRKAYILRSDVFQQWSQWFLESLADPLKYVENRQTYPHVFADVLQSVKLFFPDRNIPEIRLLAQVTAQLLYKNIEALRELRRRVSLSKNQRTLLLDLAGEPPRCWICGKIFADEAVENFRNKTSHRIPLPFFVDIFKPIGLKEQDLRIEADHVNPFTYGGKEDENLKLACGWCNRYKSSLSSIYDVEGRPVIAGTNSLGIYTLPRRFWIIRLLALSKTCEDIYGCSSSCQTHELTVYVRNPRGSFNPSNLGVFCYEHDPIKETRFQSPDIAKKIWCIN